MESSNGVSSSTNKKKRKFQIEDVFMKKKGTIEPLLVNFSNGSVLPDANLKGTLSNEVKNNMVKGKVFTVNTPRMSYAGKDFGIEAQSRLQESVFLGILDKNTGKMKLVETSSFCLNPTLKGLQSTNLHLKDSIHSLTYAEKQEQVITTFGTKKAKQYVNRRKQYQVDTEEMAQAMDQAVNALEGKSEDIMIQEEASNIFRAILPECDREAAAIENVYKLEQIAPDSFLCFFEAQATELLQGKETNPKSSLLFQQLLASAKMEENEENKLRLASLALYVEALTAFLRLKRKEIKIDSLKDICPKKIGFHILNEYTQANGKSRIRDRQNEDRVSCCAVILAFIGNKYELPVNSLLQSLTINRQKLDMLMKVIGATYSREKSCFVLKTPLAKFTKRYKKAKQK